MNQKGTVTLALQGLNGQTTNSLFLNIPSPATETQNTPACSFCSEHVKKIGSVNDRDVQTFLFIVSEEDIQQERDGAVRGSYHLVTTLLIFKSAVCGGNISRV